MEIFPSLAIDPGSVTFSANGQAMITTFRPEPF